jgi:methionine salvage enolase-phosphatase E1
MEEKYRTKGRLDKYFKKKSIKKWVGRCLKSLSMRMILVESKVTKLKMIICKIWATGIYSQQLARPPISLR